MNSHALVDACLGAPLAVEIEINHVIVFRYYPDGTGAYHEQWLRRKRNLVACLKKLPARVLRAGGQLRGSGTRLAAAARVFAACSGAFPIRIRGGSVIRRRLSGLPATRPPF